MSKKRSYGKPARPFERERGSGCITRGALYLDGI